MTHPLKGITKSIFGEYAERLEEPLLHPNPNEDYWKTHDGGADAINAVVSTTIPILLTTAFYDIYTEDVDVARTVVGKMKARIFVKSDCEDTAFYLRVSIVKGDVAYVLRDDITSILFQHEDYVSGQEIKLDFTFGDHAFLLEPGDKLRLDVSSAAFPLFLPQTNQKGKQATQSVCKIANNTLVTAKSYLEYFTMA